MQRHPRGIRRPSRNAGLRSRGFSLLELEVALLLLGIGIAGLCPLIVMQSRAMEAVERPLAPGVRHYLIPSSDEWARKLGASASILTEDPGDPVPPPTLVVNDGDPGYAETGSGWVVESDSGAVAGSYRSHVPSDTAESDTASWSFTGVKPGWYQVQVTWPEVPDRATHARYAVYDATDRLGTYVLNQRTAPSAVDDDGTSWATVATLYFESGTARLELSGKGSGRVVVDGARLVALRNTVEVLSLDRSPADESLVVRVKVEVAEVGP